MNAQLRAPGEPRADTPKIPGFGICDHPEHGAAVEGRAVNGPDIWVEEGEELDLEVWVDSWLTLGDRVIVALLIVCCVIGWAAG